MAHWLIRQAGNAARIALAAATTPMTRWPAVLVIGIGRSGTSAVGGLLGSAADALYVREPITQRSLAAGRRRRRGFTADQPLLYERWGRRAFTGIPLFPAGIVASPRPWPIAKRRVVKEADPLLLYEIVRRFDVRVIYIVRHPAGVAVSARRLGFGPDYFFGNLLGHDALMRGPLAPWADRLRALTDPWQIEGVRQAAVTWLGLRVLETRGAHRLVHYEEFCEQPERTVRDLYEFAGLTWNKRVAARVEQSTSATQGATGASAFSTRRDAADRAHAWRKQIAPDELARLREGYQLFDLPIYNEPDDWRLDAASSDNDI